MNYKRTRDATLSILGRAATGYRKPAKRTRRNPTRTIGTQTDPVARRTARKKTQAKYRRSNSDETQVAAYTRSNYAKGRKPRNNLRGAWKLLNQNKASTVYSLGLYSQFAGTEGAVKLRNASPSLTTGPFELPMHLYELNAAPNNITGTGVVTPQIGWFPYLSTPLASSATLSWTKAYSLTPVDSDSTLAKYPIDNDTMDWAQIKMLFYNAVTLPTRFQVDLVQFKDTRLVPDSTTGVSQFASAFWQAMVKRFVYNPLEGGDSKYQKYLKVLDSKTFIMEPKDTTETQNTNMKELNLFYRLNRRCTYNWQDSDTMDMLSQQTQVNDGSNIFNQVHPRARIFLMIRAQARNGVAFNANTMPSYDIVIKTKHSQFAS